MVTVPVTRVEIAEHVAPAFDYGPASTGELLESARGTQARPEVVTLLERLPNRTFRELRQLWPELPEVAIDR